MSKIIVISGHGIWDPGSKFGPLNKLLGKKPFTSLPGKCSMHFYTGNFTLLKDSSGQQLDQGNFNGVEPQQTAGPYKSVPNMILTWPRGLSIVSPAKGWVKVEYAIGAEGKEKSQIPTDSRNVLFTIKKPTGGIGGLVENPEGRLYIDDLLKVLDPAIRSSQSTLLVWSACRQVGLTSAKDKVKARFKPEIKIREELDDDDFEDFYGKWNKLDAAIVPQVKRWIGQSASIDKDTFHSIFKVPGKLQKITEPNERARMEKKWAKVWNYLCIYFLDRTLKWEIEGLNLSKRSDRLKFKKML